MIRRRNQSREWCQRRAGDDSTEEEESDQTARPYDDECIDVEVSDTARYGSTPMSLSDLDAVDDILFASSANGVGSGSPKFVEITVDSGASEAVAPPSFALGHRFCVSPGSKNGAKYRTASGNIIVNQGGHIVPMQMEG